MAPPPGPYSGTSTLALVARASAFTFGVVYGNMKLKILKLRNLSISTVFHDHKQFMKAKTHSKAEAKAHH
ncbi:hypothetical protein CUMW_070880 [Citrus unshiu]|nr:hypothetical protein CUMW_070880 [Citrus unshiu]